MFLFADSKKVNFIKYGARQKRMALYKLPFALYPIKDVFARNHDDVLQWLEWFNSKNVDVIAHSDSSGPRGIDDIVKVEKGELLFDFPGMVFLEPEFIEVDLTPDFVAKIRLESIPHFCSYQSQLKERKLGNLCVIKTYHTGIAPTCFIPKDIFEALKTYDFRNLDISEHEEHLRKRFELLNQVRSNRKYFVPSSR